jgi:hypothetical protein
MNKYIILSLLLINDSLSFSTISNVNNFRLRKNVAALRDRPSASNIQRREVFRIARVITIPYVFGNFIDIANAAKKEEKSIETLREEANRIIEIIEVQKDTFNLPAIAEANKNILRDSNSAGDGAGAGTGAGAGAGTGAGTGADTNADRDNFATIKEAKNISEKEEIRNTLNIILDDFKKNGKEKPEEALRTLQSFCADSNVIKSKEASKLMQLFADGKYGIFLGKFDNYYITNYNKIYDTDDEKTYYEVDIKLEAPYKTMIYNSIQFDEMYYPENAGDPCYIIYRWIFVKTNDKYMIDGCYLLHKPRL